MGDGIAGTGASEFIHQEMKFVADSGVDLS